MEFSSTSDRNHGGSLTRQNLLPDLFDAATDQNRNPNVLTFNCQRQVTSLAIQNPAVDQPISVLTDSLLLLYFTSSSSSLSLWHPMSLRGATQGGWWPGQYPLIKMVCWARLWNDCSVNSILSRKPGQMHILEETEENSRVWNMTATLE